MIVNSELIRATFLPSAAVQTTRSCLTSDKGKKNLFIYYLERFFTSNYQLYGAGKTDGAGRQDYGNLQFIFKNLIQRQARPAKISKLLTFNKVNNEMNDEWPFI